MFTFSHWANKLRFLIERHSKLKIEIKNRWKKILKNAGPTSRPILSSATACFFTSFKVGGGETGKGEGVREGVGEGVREGGGKGRGKGVFYVKDIFSLHGIDWAMHN
jgi:hypothetical protein